MSSAFESRLACGLCDSIDYEEIYRAPYDKGLLWNFLDEYYQGRIEKDILSGSFYKLDKCNRCGFLWQEQHLNEAYTFELYETWISAEESFEKEQNRITQLVREKRLEAGLIEHLCCSRGRDEKARVLDFGMGWGSWCLAALDIGHDVYGLELSEKRAAYCRSKGIQVLDSLSDQLDDFHYISTEQVFEHVTGPRELLADLVRHLKPGGIVRISVPNGRKFERNFEKGTWSPGKDELHPLEHINCFHHGSLMVLAGSAGLQTLSTWRLIQAHFYQILRGNIDIKWSAKNILKHMNMTAVYFEKPN